MSLSEALSYYSSSSRPPTTEAAGRGLQHFGGQVRSEEPYLFVVYEETGRPEAAREPTNGVFQALHPSQGKTVRSDFRARRVSDLMVKTEAACRHSVTGE